MKTRTNAVKLIIISICTLFLFACAANNSFVKNSYDTLTVTKQSYEAVMQSAANLYKQGIIKKADKVKIIVYGKAYKAAHNSAVEALLLYAAADKTTEAQMKQVYLDAIADASKRLATLVQFVREFEALKEVDEKFNNGEGVTAP